MNPKVNFPMRNELKNLTTKRYIEMESAVLKILQAIKSKISFTIDGWTSIANRSYFGVTAHSISDDWQMHTLTLFFIPSEGQHTGQAIAETFYEVLENSKLSEKFQGITLDNAAANTTFMTQLSRLMPFDSTDQHFRCYAHILN